MSQPESASYIKRQWPLVLAIVVLTVGIAALIYTEHEKSKVLLAVVPLALTILGLFQDRRLHDESERKLNIALREKAEWSERLIRFGWDEVSLASRSVLAQAEAEYTPDAILCLSEVSGLVVSIAGSEIKRDIPFFFACWQHKRVNSEENRRLTLGFTPIEVTNGVVYIPKALEDYCDKKILILDERCRSGGTIQTITVFLEKRHFKSLAFATLWTCKNATTEGRIGPRFWYFKTPDEDIYTPWGKLE